MGLRNTQHIPTYYAAERVFNARGPVRSRKWQDNWRPMVQGREGTRYVTCRLEQYPTHYALVLHNTTLVKLFKPYGPAGRYSRVEVYLPSRWNTVSTRQVLDRAGWSGSKWGIRISPSKEYDGLSAVFAFDGDQLLLDHSYELQLFKRRSTEADAAKREDFMKRFEPMMTMADIWFNDAIAELEKLRITPPATWPSRRQYPVRMQNFDVETVADGLERGSEIPESTLYRFKGSCESIVHSMYSFVWTVRTNTYTTELKAPPKLGACRSRLRAEILRLQGIDKGTGRELISKGESYKGTVYTTGRFPEGVDPRTDRVREAAQAQEDAGCPAEGEV